MLKFYVIVATRSDASGRNNKSQVMIAQLKLGRVYMVDPHRQDIYAKVLGPVVVDDADRVDRSDDLDYLLTETWHFDDLWVFAQENFCNLPFAPSVKKTNCVKQFDTNIHELRFTRDLKKVLFYVIKKDDEYKMKRFRRQTLPSPPSLESLPSGRAEWVLDAPWSRI